MFVRYVGVSILLFLTSSAASAQENCSNSLVVDQTSIQEDNVLNLSIAYYITENQYNEEKKNASGKTTIKGIPMGANYAEFRQNIREKAKSLKIERFEQRSFSYATSYLGGNGLEAYKFCLARRGGLELVLVSISQSSYTVRLYYTPYPGVGQLKGRIIDSDNVSESSQRLFEQEINTTEFGKVEFDLPLRPENLKREASLSVRVGRGDIRTVILPPIDRPLIADTTDPKPKLLDALAAMRKGIPANLVFDKCSGINYGTIQCNFNYKIQYNPTNNSWSMTGLHGKHGHWEGSYSNAPNAPGNLSAWESLHTFDAEGRVFLGQRETGRITPLPGNPWQ